MSRADYFPTQWICSDCLFLIANGDTPPDLDEAETVEYLARVEACTPEGFHWVAGDDHDDFSWSTCDCCDSHLGGARYSAHLVELGPVRRTIAYGDTVTVRSAGREYRGTLIQRRRETIAGQPRTLYTVHYQADRNSLGRTVTGEYVSGSMLSWADRAHALARVDRAQYLTLSKAIDKRGRKWTREPKATAVAASF